jgi:exodeoxyribonuclease I
VRATIQLARLLRKGAPKLFNHALSLGNRDNVRKIVSSEEMFCHSNSVNGFDRRFLNLYSHVCAHPSIRTSVIGWNLSHDPKSVLDLTPDEIREQKFARGEDRTIEIGFEVFATNKRPMVAKYWSEVDTRVSDYDTCKRNLEEVRKHRPQLKRLATIAFNTEVPSRELDADLYAGFIEDANQDEVRLRLCRTNPSNYEPKEFRSMRFRRQLLRLRIRNFPDSLTDADRVRGEDWIRTKLATREEDRWLCWEAFEAEFQEALNHPGLTERQAECLYTLRDYLAETHQRLINTARVD